MESLIVTFSQSFACAIAGMMFYQWVWNAFVYSKTKEDWIRNQVFLCACAFIYGVSAFFVSLGVQNDLIYSFFSLLSPFAGFMAFHFYVKVMEDHLKTKIKGMKFTNWFIVCALILIVASFIEVNFLNSNYLIAQKPTETLESILLKQNAYIFELKGPNIISLLGLTLISTYVTISFSRTILAQKRSILLLVGVLMNLVLITNDLIFGMTFFKYGMLLSFASYSVEIAIITFVVTTHLAQRNLELEGEVLEVSKIAEVGALAGQICHDIRNPLTVITSHTKRIQKALENPEDSSKINQSKDSVNKVNQMSARINNIITDYLRLMKKDSESGSNIIPLSQMVGEAIQINESKITTSGVFVKNDIESNIFMRGHDTRIVMLFSNLISNSCDAVTSLEEKWIEIKATKKGKDIIVLVTDSGKGIPKEFHDKIFKRQFTTKGEEDGVGLGLSFVQMVVMSYKGKIRVNPDCPNTQFELIFPNRAIEAQSGENDSNENPMAS